jgi:predicted nucleotidyltransferase component of viral defense system
MFAKTLSPDTFRGIKLIGSNHWLDFAYLAGGTALALRLGHRQSFDLDFFTQKKFDERVIEMQLTQTGQFTPIQIAWKTVLGKFCNIDFSLFYYKYKVLDETEDFEGIKIVGLKDIAAMKLHAIEDRGSKRDFVDLFFLTKHFSLEEVGDFYDQKYGDFEEHKHFILKGLNYFEDADSEEMRPMLVEWNWDHIKHFFSQETLRLAKAWGIG